MDDVATIGLISGTHGLMRQEALTALKGTDLIIQYRALTAFICRSQLHVLNLRQSPWTIESIDLPDGET